jgi:flagellar L-ring protein precursor FlgH
MKTSGSRILFVSALAALNLWAGVPGKHKTPEPSPLDRYIQDATSRSPAEAPASTAGSTWLPGSRLADLGSDLRASQVDDLVTILVSERASAVSQGTTKTSRQSNAKASVAALAGPTKATGALANLAGVNTQTQINGTGATSRDTTLTTTLAARVTRVLPNGYLVLEGNKELEVNGERQVITVRGVVRPVDLSPANTVQSSTLSQMEVRINGKGVVGDSIKRPFFLYRLLLGLLPF